MESEQLSILVVEDDRGIRESLAILLDLEGYGVDTVETGEAALDHLKAATPDLIILDLNLPGIDGTEVCRRLRTEGQECQILMLTARHETRDLVAGLDSGADDYLTKPFSLDELLARVRAMLRRAAPLPAAGGQASLGDLELDVGARRARRGDAELDLTKIEFDLLELLVTNAEIVLPRDVIHERIWGYDDDLGSNSLEVFISALRKKTEVGDGSRLIHTVRGVGYVARIK